MFIHFWNTISLPFTKFIFNFDYFIIPNVVQFVVFFVHCLQFETTHRSKLVKFHGFSYAFSADRVFFFFNLRLFRPPLRFNVLLKEVQIPKKMLILPLYFCIALSLRQTIILPNSCGKYVNRVSFSLYFFAKPDENND